MLYHHLVSSLCTGVLPRAAGYRAGSHQGLHIGSSSSVEAGASTVPPKKRVASSGFAKQLFGRGLHEHPPTLHDDAHAGDAESEAHVLLDYYDGLAGLDAW